MTALVEDNPVTGRIPVKIGAWQNARDNRIAGKLNQLFNEDVEWERKGNVFTAKLLFDEAMPVEGAESSTCNLARPLFRKAIDFFGQDNVIIKANGGRDLQTNLLVYEVSVKTSRATRSKLVRDISLSGKDPNNAFLSNCKAITTSLGVQGIWILAEECIEFRMNLPTGGAINRSTDANKAHKMFNAITGGGTEVEIPRDSDAAVIAIKDTHANRQSINKHANCKLPMCHSPAHRNQPLNSL